MNAVNLVRLVVYTAVVGTFVVSARNLVCQAAIEAPDPAQVWSINICGPHEVCSLEQYITSSGFIRHDLKCKDRLQCGSVTSSTKSVICSECCDSDLCAASLCRNRGVPSGRICFHCDYHVQSPLSCKHIKLCSSDEVCSVSQLVPSNQFDVKCRTKNYCATMTMKPEICSGCCSDNLCNDKCASAANKSSLNGTLCCQQYHNETWCSSAVLCSNGESCFHDVFLTDNGTKLHQLGCRSSQQCAGALPVPVGKRGSAKVLCSRCCNKAFCNTPQCQTDPCLLSNPCKYGQCFTDANGQLQCTCDIGYTGTHCDIKEVCHPNPCVHGRCSRSNLGYTCTCNHGFSGNNCDQVDPCANNNLCLHGSCSIDRSGNAQCNCDIGYTGTNCEQKDVCHPNPCLHGICKSSTSGYVCSCNHGYVGINCNIIDACAQSPCLHGKCSMSASGWHCTCDQGFSGRYCDIDIDECSSSPCKHGVCYDHVNGYSCHCFSGYTGKICEIVSAPCSSNPCKNGKCTRKGSGYDCLCNVGYAGKDCDKEIRDCKDALVYMKPSIANNTIYTIKIGTMLENVPCDMVTDGGGWTILMNRESASQDFMLDSTQYALGFGRKTGNFWIGLEDMHKLSSDGRKYQLRIDLIAANGTRYYEVYDDFSIGPRPEFTLYIGNASGTAGDSLTRHKGYGFSTKDVDRDSNNANCANYLQGAWWFYDCYDSCLTCPYVTNKPQTQQCRSMSWNSVAYCEPLKAAKMMIRPM